MFHTHYKNGHTTKEHRLLYKMANPEEAKEGVEEGKEKAKEGGESVQKQRADTSEQVQAIAGKEMGDQAPLDLRPQQPKAPVTRHLKQAVHEVPSVSTGAKATLTGFGVAFPPLGALALGVGVPLKNLWNKLRGKKERVSYSGALKEGFGSIGKVVASPFKMAYNVGKFGLDATGRTLNNVVVKPVQKLNKLLTFKSKGEVKSVIVEALKLPFTVVGGTLKLGKTLVGKSFGVLEKVVDDLDKHPVWTAIGIGLATTMITQPAFTAAVFGQLGGAIAEVIRSVPGALKWFSGFAG